jgi:ribose transport system permease protein
MPDPTLVSPPSEGQALRQERVAGRSRFFGSVADSLGLLGVLIGLVVFFGLSSNYFLTPITFFTLANQIPALVVVSVGMTFVLIIAGIDLSVGSVLALSGAVLGVALVGWQWPLWAAVLLCLAAGLGCGLVNGFTTVRWAIPSFIVTLGMLEMARGGAYLATGSQTMYIGALIEGVGAPVPGLGLSPAIFLAVGMVVLAQVVLSRTVFGRYLIAIGTNEEAVRLSGIDPRPVKVAVFALAGLLTGLGGLFQVAYLQSADPNAGTGMELAAIAAVVIGGTSLMGGRGSVVSSFFGVLIIAVLQMGLAQMGASEPMKRVITGAVIVVAVILDAYRHRLSGRRYRLPGF